MYVACILGLFPCKGLKRKNAFALSYRRLSIPSFLSLFTIITLLWAAVLSLAHTVRSLTKATSGESGTLFTNFLFIFYPDLFSLSTLYIIALLFITIFIFTIVYFCIFSFSQEVLPTQQLVEYFTLTLLSLLIYSVKLLLTGQTL